MTTECSTKTEEQPRKDHGLRNALIVAVVVALLTTLGNWGVQRWIAESERDWSKRSLAAAFVGELRARVDQAQRRQRHYGNIGGAAKKGDVRRTLNMPTERSVTIYRSNADKLGILGPDFAQRLAFVYQLDGESDEYYRILGMQEFVDWAPDDRETFLGWGKNLEQRIEKEAAQLILDLEKCSRSAVC